MKKIFCIIFLLVYSLSTKAQYRTEVVVTDLNNEVLTNKIQNSLSNLITALNNAYASNSQPSFAAVSIDASARKSVEMIWSGSPFRCEETDIVEPALKLYSGNEYEVRNIPFVFKNFPQGSNIKEFAVSFNTSGVITSFRVTIDNNSYRSIFNGRNDVSDLRRRQIILNYVEQFRTAYNTKDLVFLQNVFSDDALIITETKKLKPTGCKETIPSTQKTRPYQSIVENRKEYIRRLKGIFDSNTSIKLSIAGKRIRQHAKYKEIYGVNFTQLWKDQNGGDNLESQMPGFVFLMIDFKHSEQMPTIHVRTWQPKDNIEKEQDKYFLRDFMIYETK